MSIIINAYLMTTGGWVAIVLAALVGGILIGLGLFLLITKLQKRSKRVKIRNTKASDYQYNFKLNTGQFLNDLKNKGDNRE